MCWRWVFIFVQKRWEDFPKYCLELNTLTFKKKKSKQLFCFYSDRWRRFYFTIVCRSENQPKMIVLNQDVLCRWMTLCRCINGTCLIVSRPTDHHCVFYFVEFLSIRPSSFTVILLTLTDRQTHCINFTIFLFVFRMYTVKQIP